MKLAHRFREIRRVALYVRVSTREQAEGHSLDSQRADLTAWASAEGWEVFEVYEDPGASGTSVEGRFGFQRMIRDAREGKFDAILIVKVDRFARSVRDSATYREALAECGVRLLSRMEPSAGNGPADFLTAGMFDLNAAYYSILLSHNVTRGKRMRAEKGLLLGDLPFGYRSVNPKEPPQIVPQEAVAVRQMFEEYAAGNRSMLDIADRLNAQGFRPRSKRGRPVFSKATVGGMLSNPSYIGDVAYHGEVIGTGEHEPIVSRELWDKVQRVRQERARKVRIHRTHTRRPYLLAGVAICGSCGSPLWANTIKSGRHHYYRCASRNRGDDCPNRRVSCRAELPEETVAALFARLELPEDWRRRVEELARTEGNRIDVVRERRRLEERISRARDGFLNGVLDSETARIAIAEAEAALAVLSEPGEEPVRALDVLTEIRDLWPHMKAEERRDLVRLVLVEVGVDTRTGDVKGLKPKPAFAPLFRILAEEEGGLVRVCEWRPRPDSNRRSPP